MAKFYSVGVGAGDSSYITLGALRALETADVIAAPVKKHGEKSAAFEIISHEFDISKKEILELEFPMTRDAKTLEHSREYAAKKIISALRQNKTVAMITLGDVSVYSTCSYMHSYVKNAGFEIEIIPAVTSFCAAADKAGISLCEGGECVAILPSLKSKNLEKYLDDFDTIILMKAGGDTDEIYKILKSHGLGDKAVVSSRIGMENELTQPLQEGKSYGYFTTVIIKKNL